MDDWKSYADGRVFSGKQAFDLGFVDELGNFDQAVERAQELGGVTNADLVQYRAPMSFSSLFRIFGQTHAPAIKVDLGVELPKIIAGKMYFLTPTLFH